MDHVTKTSLDSICECGYGEILERLSKKFDGRLWIVGGWIRNSALGCKYLGDVDCVVPFTASEIESRISGIEEKSTPNNFGGHRIYLPDNNHIDLMGTYQYNDTKDILKTVRSFNFSVNSAAINYQSKRFICSSEFAHDIQSRTFTVLPSARYTRGTNATTLCRDYEVLVYYNELQPIDNSESKALNATLNGMKERTKHLTFDKTLKRAADEVQFLLPKDAHGWIVRGYVRAANYEELQYWDDIDVIVDADQEELLAHLATVHPDFSINYFGTPKIILENARIDIWTLDNSKSIESAVSKFSHNVDMVAWSINKASLETATIDWRYIEDRLLLVNEQYLNEAHQIDIDYCAIKSVYLLARHQMSMTDSVRKLLKRDIKTTPFLLKHIIRLVRELHLCGIDDIDNTLEYINESIGPSEAVSLVRKYWKPLDLDNIF